MEEAKIFYSWQSDLDPETHQYLIRGCLNKVIKHITTPELIFSLDESTVNVPGCPDISECIIQKIDDASIFVADLSPITTYKNKLIPNPNVLFEFGYAFKTLTAYNVLCVVDEDCLQDDKFLPFDISHKRYIPYNSSKKEVFQILYEKLNIAIRQIIKHKSFLHKLSFIKDCHQRDLDIIRDVLLDCNFDALDSFFEMAQMGQMRQDILIYWEGFYRKIDSSIFILDNKDIEIEFKKLRENIGNFLDSIEDADFNYSSHIYHIKKFNPNISCERINKYIEEAKLNSKRIAQLLHEAFPTLNLAESNKKAFEANSPYFYR